MITKRRVNICQKTTTLDKILMLFHMHWIRGKTLASTISISASRKQGAISVILQILQCLLKRKNKLTFNVIKECYANCK